MTTNHTNHRTNSSGPPLIQCRRLTKTYKKGDNTITPLQELDLDVPTGDFLALMGPSGSGKTTLLNLIAGIDRPSGGNLIIGGTDISTLSRSKLADWRSVNVGYVFQLYNLVPVLTAYENVELPLLLHSMSAKDRHDHYPRQLSGGQEQRVAIARAIVTDPTLIVGDEPTGDLDQESAQAIMDLMVQLCEDLGKTLIIVTHDAKSAAYAKRTLHLEKGRLVEAELLATRHAPLVPQEA